MQKYHKLLHVTIVIVCILVVAAVAVGDVPSQREADKMARAERQQQLKSTTATQGIDPDVAAKLEMEAAIEAKMLQTQAEGGDEAVRGVTPVKPQKPQYQYSREEQRGAKSIMGHPESIFDPRTVYFSQDFEDTLFPPTGWDTINTDPGYGFFRGIYAGGGTYAALVTWHAVGYIQDEWLISPMANLTSATGDLRLEFWFLKGYAYPHEFKVYVSTDGTTFNAIWDSDTTGYPTFTWWKYVIDMSAYAGESQLWVGFQYYGEDADLFGVDDIVLTDDAPPVGRCCYGDPGSPLCDDILEDSCNTLGGTWNAALNCTDDPCPVAPDNDSCAAVTPVTLPYTFTGNNETATYDTYCQWFQEYPNVWIAFELTECSDVTIEYCGCPSGWGNGWLNLITDCACPDGTLLSYNSFDWGCANGNPRVYFLHLDPGVYYYPVMLDPGNGAVGDYVLDVSAVACPPAQPGDNCEEPDVHSFGSGDLPYTVANQYTCGRLDDYNATCLGSYDNGEDYIMELTVTDDMWVNITLDPKGTTWSGMSIDDECPDLNNSCINKVATSSGSPKVIPNVQLLTGTTYYIMVDTWPSPDCIPDFDVIFEAAAGPQEGDNCANPIKVDIPTLPYHDYGQTTCGRVDDYDLGCLGSYDNGEDIIYEITVLSEVTVNITLDPLGTTYTGMALSTDCPGADPCLYEVTGSSSSPKGWKCVTLSPGVYYLMVDTWPSPDCIPAFDLHIEDTTCAAIENDDCENATEVGDVTDLAFSTTTASFDGSGTCQYAPNIWYCYTATCDGKAIISLCGSDYDTKMAVYDGCTCSPLGTELACNDDACGLQSEVEVFVTAGNSYLIEVGGYSSNTGDGLLTIYCEPPCEVPCTGTPEGEACIADDGEDVTNGGCNSDPAVWGDIECAETVCGEWNTYNYFGSNYRDTDWYRFTLTEFSDVTIVAAGEFPLVTGFLEQVVDGGGWDCTNFTGYISPYATGDECDTVVVTRLGMPAGDYAIFVGGTVFTGYPCVSGTFEYSLSVECTPAVPTYCTADGGCDEYIENVTFETINNTTGCDGYGDYTAMSATVAPETSYPISITIGNAYSLDTAAVYVDWNQDLDFNDPGEVAELNPGHGYGPYSGTVTVPAGALPGPTRMRVRLAWNTTPVPCGHLSYGEVEDYTVEVVAPEWHMQIPEPYYVFMKWSIDPNSAHLYISDGATEQDINTWENIALSLPDDVPCDIPITATEVIPGDYGDLVGPVLHLTFDGGDWILCEEAVQDGLLWGMIESFFDVSYEVSSVPYSWSASCQVRGHVSGDANLDGELNVADLSFMVSYLFLNGPEPRVWQTADVDGSEAVNVADLSFLVSYLFHSGPAPTHP